MGDDVPERFDRRVDQAREFYEHRGRVFRALWVTVGIVVVLAGVAMTVLPGPVTIVVPLGLAMLAAAFGWARRLLLASVRRGVEAKHMVEDTSTKTKALGGGALACLAAAVIALVLFQLR